jgi:hypothetical protein
MALSRGVQGFSDALLAGAAGWSSQARPTMTARRGEEPSKKLDHDARLQEIDA